jgi:hypothetical protein
MKTLTIDLIDPIETHAGLVTQMTLREPRAKDFFSLGEPYQVARAPDGSFFTVDKDDVILSYIERCMQAPIDPVMFGTTSLANAMKVRGEFLGFFDQARGMTSPAPANSSSSS